MHLQAAKSLPVTSDNNILLLDCGRGPRISVVVVNYNYQSFIGDAVRSVLTQTYWNVECIVVDDGSTDQSRDVINTFSGIRVIQQQNSGQTGAARAGLSCVTGEIVLFLNSDDFLFPDACATIAASWKPGDAAVLFRLAVVREGTITDESLPAQPFVQEAAADFVRKYGYLPAAPSSGNAYSVDVVQKIFSNSVKLEDRCFFDTWLINCSPFLGAVTTIDRCLGGYRIHGTNVSLAAKRTLNRVKAQTYYNYWAQRSAAKFAAESSSKVRWGYLKGPYWLKWHILTRHISVPQFDLPEHSETACVLECCREFLTFPGIPLWKRLANFIFMCAYLILPRKIVYAFWVKRYQR